MKFKALFLTLLIALVPALASAHEYSHGKVRIDHPWSRPTPPGTPMGVGYLAIVNNSMKDITLTAAETPRAGHVSIHESLMKDGVMRMQALKDGLKIPAGDMVELKPHGYHLMLEQLKEPLKAGERIPLNLYFDGVETMKVELLVEPLDKDMSAQPMNHSGHGME